MSHTLTLEIPDEAYRILTSIAFREGKTPEEMGARWLATTIERLQTDPVEQYIGAFSSDVPDWAERHDFYLGEGLLKQMSGDKD